MPTKAKGKSRFWRKCRIYFRRFRLTVWCVTLAVLGALVYLNQIGLPDFLKHPLQKRLQDHGLALEFSELRLHWSRGFVAEQVRFGASASTNHPAVPRFTARELEINLHLRALLLARIQVDAIALRGGKIEWTLTQTNAPERILSISNIETSLRLLPGDRWLLDDLRGQFSGANFFLSGSLTNASALRELKAAPATTNRWPERLRRLADITDQIKFKTPPEVRLDVHGDARDLGSFSARLSVKGDDADTAWGRARQVLFMAQMFPAATNEPSRAELSLQAQNTETRWANVTNLDAKLRLITVAAQPELVDAAATIRAAGVTTRWASVAETQLKASWTHTLTNPIPRAGRVELHTDKLTTWLTRATDLDFAATWAPAINPPAPEAALGFWTNLLPYQVQWTTSIGALRTIAFQADRLSCAGDWAPPQLTLENLQASLYRGSLTGRAQLDVVSRVASVSGASDFEFKALAPLLDSKSQEELAKFTWAQPPQFRAAATFVLPAWTNQQPERWQAEVLPTLQLAAAVALTNASYQGVHADRIATRCTYTNSVWELPDLEITRPEGALKLVHRANDVTRDYYFKLHSTIDPQAVLPLFAAEVRRGFDLCEFGQPPVLSGELWGRWDDPTSVGFRGHIALTNFAFRGQAVDAVVTGLYYTNLVLACLEPRIYRGTQHLALDGVTADFITHRTHFTNGFSTIDPGLIVRAIGPAVAEVMAPYHFGKPPTARFNGYTSMGNPHDADVIFEGEGDDFESLHFRATHYVARVIWKNNLLTVTNVYGDFYGGKASGWAHFIFPDQEHAQYAFGVNVTNAQLSPLVADQTRKPNNLEGLLTGQLVVTNAWTDNIKSWDGYGHAILRDGLLWELPVFGVLSGPLDSIMPGVGNSRFTEAKGTFGVGKSVIYSPDLEMRSSTMRLQYRGAVDFDGNINARVIAEPLRDTPVVGSVVSTILAPVARLFAYRITGTMKEPKSEPIYIPAPVMILFSPFQSLGGLFTPAPAPVSVPTNAPPEIK
jgi:hypothetical protein